MDERRQTKQLSFENLKVNTTVPVEMAPRLKRQTQAIYRALQAGPLWTRNLRAMAAQYNARLKELREHLREFGTTVDMTARGADGNNRFELRPFAGSKYQTELMARQAKGKKGSGSD